MFLQKTSKKQAVSSLETASEHKKSTPPAWYFRLALAASPGFARKDQVIHIRKELDVLFHTYPPFSFVDFSIAPFFPRRKPKIRQFL